MTASDARPVPAADRAAESHSGPGNHRRHERDSLLLKATLRLADGHDDYSFRVRNLSATGLMGEASFEIAPGTQVVVSLRNIGWVAGTVAWSLDCRFGLAFHTEIDPRAVRQAPVLTAPPIAEVVDLVVRRPLVAGKPAPREPVPRAMRPL